MQLTENNKNIKSGLSRGTRILLFSLAFILLAATAALIYWNTHKKGIIRNKLENAIAKKSGGLYKISYDSLDLNELSGWLSVKNMRIGYDTAAYLLAEKNDDTPPLLFSIQVPSLKVTGVKTPRALVHNEVVGRKVEIMNPVIDLYYTYKGKDSARNMPTSEIYRELLGGLNLVQLDTLQITGATLRTTNRITGRQLVKADNLSVTLTGVKVDSVANEDSSRLLFSEALQLHCAHIAWTSPNKLYEYGADDIRLNSASSSLQIGGFAVSPVLGEDAFVNAIPAQDDRFNFTFKNIRATQVNAHRLLDEYFSGDSLVIGSSSFYVYRDLARPRDKKNRVGFYPHQVLTRLPIRVAFNTVYVPGAFIEYKERNHITRNSGKVQFHKVNAVFTNFTNDPQLIARNNTLRADVRSVFLNRAPLATTWIFYLRHPKGRFSVKGTVGGMDATLLNPLAEPMGPARIEKGQLKGVEFDLQADDYGVRGPVKVLYNDLKVSLLEKDKGAITTDKKFFTSLLANIIIKNDNPKRNDEVRTAQVEYTRDINRSIFNACWKALFQGIRETVGIKTRQ